ncbi:MAG: hypothetical protein H7A49_02500 [Akkermansiaceae bacterium]|nr:hypothetical protein [Akkermansiaceae bacterium]MCP5542758.1 hypothetical protein [Akkermansiaceae bacterium]MCP5548824.1 hypothetical protein [Akkermansiaceae bacterium]
MAELIQFPCPACDAVLRLPLARAGWQGGCPRCGREIIAPSPQLGIGARLAPEEADLPFADIPPPPPSAPAAVDREPPAPVAEEKPVRLDPVREIPRPTAAARESRAPDHHRPVLVLSVLLSSVVSLVAGYLLGVRSDWLIARTPFPELPEIPTATVQPVKPAPAPVLVKPVTAPAPEATEPAPAEAAPETTAAPATEKASSVAEAALRAFLDAPDWTARSAYVLSRERVSPLMESYAREHPDGPTPITSLSVESSYTAPGSGETVFVFKVTTERVPTGFHVPVAETKDGWLVDWESFVEFRDDRFRLFAEGPADHTGRFHLLVRKPNAEQAVGTENEHFTTFLVEPPLPDRQRLAYVRKGSDPHTKLNAATAGDLFTAPVLELAKRTTPDGKSYLEITRIVAGDWLPDVP